MYCEVSTTCKYDQVLGYVPSAEATFDAGSHDETHQTRRYCLTRNKNMEGPFGGCRAWHLCILTDTEQLHVSQLTLESRQLGIVH